MFEGEYSNFIFMEPEGYIFSYVPKVACTNWKCLLRRKLGYENWLESQLAHDRNCSGLPYLSEHVDPALIIADPKIKKYTMVRNPYSRVLSAYLNKIAPWNREQFSTEANDWYAKVFGKIKVWGRDALSKDDEQVSFLLFLQWLENSGDVACQDEHWVSQWKLLKLEHVEFDFIGRFENLLSDAPELMQMMGIPGAFPSQRDVKFPATAASSQTLKYYGDEEKALVDSIYEDDFIYLHY